MEEGRSRGGKPASAPPRRARQPPAAARVEGARSCVGRGSESGGQPGRRLAQRGMRVRQAPGWRLEWAGGLMGYEPGQAFNDVKEEAMLDISPTESTEFWLIQWPKDQLDVSDFHGKELSLKLHKDGNLGSLESSSVGKISRRVCLARYPEPEELAKPTFGALTPSSKISAVSSRKTKSRFTSASKNRSSQGSALSLGQWSAEPTPKHKQKRKDGSGLGPSNMSGKASEGSQARGGESNTASEMPQSSSEKSKKKKKVRIME
nr:unnamed protein product [Digitaria exilis]